MDFQCLLHWTVGSVVMKIVGISIFDFPLPFRLEVYTPSPFSLGTHTMGTTPPVGRSVLCKLHCGRVDVTKGRRKWAKSPETQGSVASFLCMYLKRCKGGTVVECAVAELISSRKV